MKQLSIQVKNFIEQHIDLIDKNDFESIYYFLLPQDFDSDFIYTGLFTETMLECGINPLDYLEAIPDNYLYESDITDFKIPDHIKSIGQSAFDSCDQLTKLIIPKNITFIDDYALYSCDKLTTLQIDNVDINFRPVGVPNYIPVIKFNGNKDKWLAFIERCHWASWIECGRLELIGEKPIFNYKGQK